MTEPLAGRTLALVHTVTPLIEVFRGLVAELLPGVRTMGILDEPLLEVVKRRGALADDDVTRLIDHARWAAEAGADVLLVTCSTVSPLVDRAQTHASIPILKIDEAMIREAVGCGTRIGVVATAGSTLDPSRRMLETEAARCGKPIGVELVLVDRALPALLAGDTETHDQLIGRATLALAASVDVIVLAQASMARALPSIAALPSAGAPTPVLSSPHAALAQVRAVLSSLRLKTSSTDQ
jgi:Asp/Glu/hydantoin racemase